MRWTGFSMTLAMTQTERDLRLRETSDGLELGSNFFLYNLGSDI
jgi:hypothetical protein|eukprot:COSAG06_NODE_232_length_19645_cov_254.342423_11_plen_44_part_00